MCQDWPLLRSLGGALPPILLSICPSNFGILRRGGSAVKRLGEGIMVWSTGIRAESIGWNGESCFVIALYSKLAVQERSSWPTILRIFLRARRKIP